MNNRRTVIMLCLLLSFAVLCGSAAADTPFSFRGGITWDTTVEEMLDAEGVDLHDQNVHSRDENGFSFYSIQEEGEGDVNVFYTFRWGELVTAAVALPRDTKVVKVFAAKAEEYEALWGASAALSGKAVAMLCNTLVPESTLPGDIDRALAWWLSDGTLAVLLTIRGENSMMYIHEERLFAEAGTALYDRGGVAWDMTAEQILRAEGVTQADGQYGYWDDDYTQYVFARQSGDGEAMESFYIFKMDRLVMYGGVFGCDGDVWERFYQQLEKLRAEYGEPAADGRQRLMRLLNMLLEDEMPEGAVRQLASWELEDGKELYLFALYGESVFFQFTDSEAFLANAD